MTSFVLALRIARAMYTVLHRMNMLSDMFGIVCLNASTSSVTSFASAFDMRVRSDAPKALVLAAPLPRATTCGVGTWTKPGGVQGSAGFFVIWLSMLGKVVAGGLDSPATLPTLCGPLTPTASPSA